MLCVGKPRKKRDLVGRRTAPPQLPLNSSHRVGTVCGFKCFCGEFTFSFRSVLEDRKDVSGNIQFPLLKLEPNNRLEPTVLTAKIGQ